MTRDMLLNLTKIDEPAWDEYILRSDLFYHKLNREMKEIFAKRAKECARQAADSFMPIYETQGLEGIIENLGGKVERSEDETLAPAGTFALFREPDTVILFPKKYEAAQKAAKDRSLSDITEEWDFENIALAHELYHFYEKLNADIFTTSKMLCLWSIGRHKKMVRLESLREIAAAEFAKRLLDSNHHQCVLELFLLSVEDEPTYNKLYKSIMEY